MHVLHDISLTRSYPMQHHEINNMKHIAYLLPSSYNSTRSEIRLHWLSSIPDSQAQISMANYCRSDTIDKINICANYFGEWNHVIISAWWHHDTSVRQSYCRSCCRAGDLQPVMLLKPSGKYSLSSTQINYMHSPYTKPLKVYIHSVVGKMLPRKAVTALQYHEKPVLLLLPHVPLVNVILRCSDRMLWHTQKTDW